MNKSDKILITGSTGMVGSALKRILEAENYTNIIAPTHAELDLCEQEKVLKFFQDTKPDYVFHLAAIVGGIHANNEYPADFVYKNTAMQLNVVDSSHKVGVKKLLFPGSACTYPKMAKQPIIEDDFLNGKIEITNIAYAAAKINGIILCQSYSKQHGLKTIVPMPTNTYGVGDNFKPEQSHVIPALMTRFHNAKNDNTDTVEIWGSGTPLREFIYVDDLAQAFVFLMENYDNSDIINVGTMDEITIKDLALKIAEVIGFDGNIKFDDSKPDGAPRKCLDSNQLNKLGWKPETSLDEGLRKMYEHHFNS